MEVNMSSQRAIIFALDSIITVAEDERGYHWRFDPQLPGLLRDYKALGYRLIGIFDPMAFAVDLDDPADGIEIMAYINALLRAAGAPEFEAIHLAEDPTDPRPIWDLRRRFGFSLAHSILVAVDEQYEALRSNAGIGRFEWAPALLGPVAAVG